MAPKIHHHFLESKDVSSSQKILPHFKQEATPLVELKSRKRKRPSLQEFESSSRLRNERLNHQQPVVEHSALNSYASYDKEDSLPVASSKDLISTSRVPSYKPDQNKKSKGQKHLPSKPPPNHTPLKAKAQALEAIRKTLPVWSHATEIRRELQNKDVLIISGETGSGKSTQIPQLISEESWCKAKSVNIKNGEATTYTKVGGCIAITQPRRVAAITLARRVAEEMGTPLGSSSPSSRVGYSVRFDNSTSPSTRIKFLTEGMLLQEMLRDPWLRQYSAVIVDEVHERSVNVDLILGFLRNMICGDGSGRGGVPIKVAVMSATVDTASLREFFETGFSKDSLNSITNSHSTPTHQTEDVDVIQEDGSEWSGIASEEDKNEVAGRGELENNNILSHVSMSHIQGRQYPVIVRYSPEPVQDYVDTALRTIFQIHYKEPLPGDILVFLTGQETIESLEDLVNEYALNLTPEVPKLLVLALFAALPQSMQQKVFLPTPPKTRKVILATNIAETSVTVSGVRFVIDCGKSKAKQFRTRLGLDSLLVKPISKSAATQRKGRAGREAPGQCYRLYTEQDYQTLSDDNVPEILRCDLSQAILNMKARGVRDVLNFPFLSRPPREALEKALTQLLQLGALRENGEISDVGMKIARLPLSAPLGRVLLAAAEPEADCLAEAIDIISCLSVENIFLNLASEEAKEKAEAARRELFRREGDHLTLLATVQAYAAENADRKAWAERHFVSHRALQAVMDVRKQLLAQCKTLELHFPPPDQRTATLGSERVTALLKCFLKGSATNTARLFPDGSYKTMFGNQTVAIHPSSGLFGKRVEAIMYNEYVYTNRSYARGVSAVQMDWIGEALGAT